MKKEWLISLGGISVAAIPVIAMGVRKPSFVRMPIKVEQYIRAGKPYVRVTVGVIATRGTLPIDCKLRVVAKYNGVEKEATDSFTINELNKEYDRTFEFEVDFDTDVTIEAEATLSNKYGSVTVRDSTSTRIGEPPAGEVIIKAPSYVPPSPIF